MSPSPYNSVWALNILKNHFNIEMGQDRFESESKPLSSKWKIRKIKNNRASIFEKKKKGSNQNYENQLQDIPENSKEDNFNSIYLDEYKFPNFSKGFLNEMNRFHEDIFYKSLGNFKNFVYFYYFIFKHHCTIYRNLPATIFN